MENLKIEKYLPGIEQITGMELSGKDKEDLIALMKERHFKKFDLPADGLHSFLKVIIWIQANPWPGIPGEIPRTNPQPIHRQRSAPPFPKATRKSEKGKIHYIMDCTRGFVEYLKAHGLPGLDSMHLAGRIIALVYHDWYPFFENGTCKGLGGERNFVLQRMRHLLSA
jgi:hypothetical protein